jgi:hypothetical protein
MARYDEIFAGIKVFIDRGDGDGDVDGVTSNRDEVVIGWSDDVTDDEKVVLTSAGWRYDPSSRCWRHMI